MIEQQVTTSDRLTSDLPQVLKEAPILARPSSTASELQSVGTALLNAGHADFATFHQTYVSQNIGLADTKAGVAFGLASAAIGWLITQEPLQALLLHPAWSAPFVVLVATLGLLAVSALSSLLGCRPGRRRGSCSSDR
jgi:hypothetical protein